MAEKKTGTKPRGRVPSPRGKAPQGAPQGKPPEKNAPEKSAPERKPLPDARPAALDEGKAKPDQASVCRSAGLLLFNRWDLSGIEVSDAGLKAYINLTCLPVPRTGGKYGHVAFQKNRMSVVERFMNKLMVTGHRGKKHKITSGRHAGKVPMLYKTVKEAFMIIEKRTKQNPVQVLVGALVNAGPLEEVASYRLGGIIARNSVVTSPQRRLDLALRHLTQGIYRTSFKNKKPLASVIADELIAAFSNDSKSFAVSEKNRLEKEAEGAR